WNGNSMKARKSLRQAVFTLCIAALFPLELHANDYSAQQSKTSRWPVIRANLFAADRQIYTDDTISLITPKRAENAAIVPISVNANIEQTTDLYISKIYLVVDDNPSPVVGVFTMSQFSGLASLSTRIRVNAYSNVRAIAETSDGKLHMAVNFVKASGGCSAPAGTNDEEAIKRRGKMKLRQQKHDDLLQVQLMISHPNYSGLQIDQVSRNWIPADYVNELQVSFDNDAVISFVGGISMSENPSLRFYFKPGKEGSFLADVKDSQGREYSQRWPLAEL
ncbi:MAG: quinoprotein dehydrogenase-associated SoxYZ-like carrier, partial [Pseudomonadales bacterium]